MAASALPAFSAQAGRIAPALTTAAGHMVGLPKWLTHAAAGAAAPVSAVGTALERIPPGGYGRIPGMVRGSYPVEREDTEGEPAAAPAAAPAVAETPESMLATLAALAARGGPSGLGGMAGQAVDRARGDQNAQNQ